MTELYKFWSGIEDGDAVKAPYSHIALAEVWRVIFQQNRTSQGYIDDYLNELAVTSGVNTATMDTGAALVDGTFYENDAAIAFSIPTPISFDRVDRIVLRKSFSGQTIRSTLISGTEGGGTPSLTQTAGVTWDIPIAQISITTGGVITITDERVVCRTPLGGETTNTGGYELIEELEGDGSTTTDLDFTNIPQTFKHLLLIGQLQHTRANTIETVAGQFNGDTGANYNQEILGASSASAVALGAAGITAFDLGTCPAASATANFAGSYVYFINNYTDTSFDKIISGQFMRQINNTTADFRTFQQGWLWTDTSAIERIRLFGFNDPAGFWTSGSKMSLYGVP